MFVALYLPHNEGCVSAIVIDSSFNIGNVLMDKHEVDAEMGSFATMQEARQWLESRGVNTYDPDWQEVVGGYVLDDQLVDGDEA